MALKIGNIFINEDDLSLLKQIQISIPMSKDIMFTKIYGSQQ